MTQYSLPPFWVEVNYTIAGLDHSMKFSVGAEANGGVSGGYAFLTKDGSSISPIAGMTEWLSYAANLFTETNTTLGDWSFWRQLPGDDNPILNFAGNFNQAGTGPFAPILGAQATYTLRDTSGKGFRSVVLDTGYAALSRVNYAGLTVEEQNYIDYVISADSFVKSRAGNYLGNFVRRSVSYNDSLTRKRFNVS